MYTSVCESTTTAKDLTSIRIRMDLFIHYILCCGPARSTPQYLSLGLRCTCTPTLINRSWAVVVWRLSHMRRPSAWWCEHLHCNLAMQCCQFTSMISHTGWLKWALTEGLKLRWPNFRENASLTWNVMTLHCPNLCHPKITLHMHVNTHVLLRASTDMTGLEFEHQMMRHTLHCNQRSFTVAYKRSSPQVHTAK